MLWRANVQKHNATDCIAMVWYGSEKTGEGMVW